MKYGLILCSVQKIMAKLEVQGRLGNNLIQFICAYIFCCKHNLNLNYENLHVPYHCNYLGKFLDDEMVKCISNNHTKKNNDYLVVNDDNYYDTLNQENIDYEVLFKGDMTLHFRKNYHQIFDILCENRQKIKKLFRIDYKNFRENDLYIHYRLGDINDSSLVLPLEYYIQSIESVNFEKGYISSDLISDKKCQYLINKYNLIPLELPPYETIMYAKDFNNLILSESTFSFIIGYFSMSKNIIHNSNPNSWGDNFLYNFKEFNFNKNL